MNYKNYCRGGQPYETPTVNVLAFRSEGILCGSFDEDNYTEKLDRLPFEDL